MNKLLYRKIMDAYDFGLTMLYISLSFYQNKKNNIYLLIFQIKTKE